MRGYAAHHHESPLSLPSRGGPETTQADTLVYQRLRELFDEQLRHLQTQNKGNRSMLPCVPGKPRINAGPDGYKGVCDEDLSQWIIDEAQTLKDLADIYMVRTSNHTKNNESLGTINFLFKNDFETCCAKEVKQLRTEAVNRIGPSAKLLTEQSQWEMLFPEEGRYLATLSPDIQSGIMTTLPH